MVYPVCTVHGCIVGADDKELQEVLPVMTKGNVSYSNFPKMFTFEVKESRPSRRC